MDPATLYNCDFGSVHWGAQIDDYSTLEGSVERFKFSAKNAVLMEFAKNTKTQFAGT